jgi:hypothetical protein
MNGLVQQSDGHFLKATREVKWGGLSLGEFLNRIAESGVLEGLKGRDVGDLFVLRLNLGRLQFLDSGSELGNYL